jgi:arabinofuranosyltransferase
MKGGLAATLACLALLLVVVVHKAWITDDAYITFRAARNLVEGRGLTWNPGERVQVFTHPLWMLIMSGAYSVTREFFYSALALNVALTLGTALLLAFRLASSPRAACLGLAVLAASRAFTDFATSGLENSLLHFLLVLLLLLDASRASPAPLLRFSVVAGLCLLTRLDSLWLVLPAWSALVLRAGLRRSAPALLAGVAPLAAWEAFSLLYFGSLLPNSALAKLASGIPATELMAQGMLYLRNSLLWDPVTLAIVAAACAAAWRATWTRSAAVPSSPWAWALGMALMLFYVVRVGGDFMSGRFLTAPLVVGVGLLVSRPVRGGVAKAATAAALALLVVPWTSPFVERDYGRDWHAAIDDHGIADERTFYRESGSLRASWGQKTWPDPRSFDEARWLHRQWPHDNFAAGLLRIGELSAEDRWPPATAYDENGRPYRKVFLRGAVGFLGYHVGPDAWILDYHAICDPLLARLPATVPDPILGRLIPRLKRTAWRVGHYYHRPPVGYALTLASGHNVIRDPALARYYDVLRRITQDPVLDRERLKTLWRFQLGAYDGLLREAAERSGK